mgnify:CR=1 FL=1
MKSINAKLLKEMLISGANNLYNHYPEIDALNVFPVPDGDTGTNMNLTLASGVKEIMNRNDSEVYTMCQTFSKGCLFGSRGNSGVITSQIFKGFTLGLEGLKVIGCFDLINAFQKAKEVPYTAVKNPVEGTILTVLRESTDHLKATVTKEIPIERCFEILLGEARESLKRTPDLLPILKEVGVVDSGGAGLVYLFEGMLSAVKGKVIERNQDATSFAPLTPVFEKSNVAKGAATMEVDDDEEFGYCTEFILTIGEGENKKPFLEDQIKNHLNKEGKSLVFVRDGEILKVHIHTLTPGAILNYVQQYGEFLTLKIENMTKQHSHLKEGANAETFTPKEEHKETKPYGLIAVGSGNGIEEIFKELGVNYVVKGGQTMNPSTEDFVNAIKEVNAKVVYVLPNNSNIVMAASQACDSIDFCDARVIPSNTILQGMTALMNFSSEIDADTNFEEMRSALKNVSSGSVTKAIKDTEINGVKVVKDNYIGIMDKNILSCVNNVEEALFDLIKGMVTPESAVLTVIYGEDVSSEEANVIENKLSELYPDLDISVREGGQPHYQFFVGIE